MAAELVAGLTAGDLLSGGLSALGGALSFLSNSGSNKTAKKIARENREFAEKMYDKQIAYNWEMFNAENEYNSPQAQVQRYLEAGINPALAMENGSAATAQGGSVSPPSVPGENVPIPYDWSKSFDRIADIVYNHQLRQEQLKAAELANEDKAGEVVYNQGYRDLMLRRGLQQLQNDVYAGLMSKEQYQEAVSSWQLRRGAMAEDMRYKRGQADYQDTLIVAQALENGLKKFHLEKAPEEFKAQMAVLGANAQQLLSQRDANYARVRTEYMQQAKLIAETYGIKVNNKLLDETFNSSVLAANQKNWADYRENWLRGQAYMDAADYLFKQPGSRNTLGRAYSLGLASGLSVSPTGLSVNPVKLGK